MSGKHARQLVLIGLMVLYFARGQKQVKKNSETEEDRQFLRESVLKHGPPQRHELYDLPGPEIEATNTALKKLDSFSQVSNNFTHRYRSKSKYFSYNGRYEITHTKIVNGKEIIVVRGQVSEEFPRNNSIFYIRTIGYTFDENGFRTFLIDVSKIVTRKYRIKKAKSTSDSKFGDGGSSRSIPGSALASLIGGGLG